MSIMEGGILDISKFMETLTRHNISSEELIGRSMQNLYSLETNFLSRSQLKSRNCTRETIAYVKALYDMCQQMSLARIYLLHKIKLLEVRETDMTAEISILRGVSSPSEGASLERDVSQGLNELSRSQDPDVDDELEIIMDTRMISEIDQSKVVLMDISQKIEDKKQLLSHIEKQMDDASSFLTSINESHKSSMPDEELHYSLCSVGIERTQEASFESRSRSGDSRMLSPKYIEMAMSQEKEINLLPQGELGTPRGRHGGEPDTAGSTVSVRKSCEGTGGVASASAPPAQVATAELFGETEDPKDLQESMEAIQTPCEKRKASMSPFSDDEEVGARRHFKARIVESVDAEKEKEDDTVEMAEANLNIEDATNAKLPSSSPEACGISKKSLRNSGAVADFSALKASRSKKAGKEIIEEMSSAVVELDKPEIGSDDSVDKIIQPIIKRIENKETDLDYSDDVSYIDSSLSSRSRKNKRAVAKTSKYVYVSSESDKERDRLPYKSNRRGRGDKSVKNPINKSKRKITIPEIITKDEAEKERGYTREDWLNMDGAELGTRCLEHLAELDRQRTLCSNMSGQVAGRMKDGKYVAAEITKALVEKLATAGDVYGLRNENFSLKEEVNELKRKEQAQAKEIDSLRRTITMLEREVRSLKEGFGPFPATALATKSLSVSKSPIKELGRKRSERRMQHQRVEEDNAAMEIELLPGSVPVDSFDAKCPDWSGDDDPAFRSGTPEKNKESVNVSKNKFRSSKAMDIKINDKESLVVKNFRVKEVKSVKGPRNKEIKIVENRQIVPPSYLPPPDREWSVIGRRGRIVSDRSGDSERVSSVRAAGTESRRRVNSGNGGAGGPGRRLVKPAVVTITNRPGGLSYAQILAKARDQVSLKDLGIQTTTIRRAMNGAIIIEIPGPQGKRLAGDLSSKLAMALGEDARVLNPVAMGELRLRGIDPSTTSEEIRAELEVLGGCTRQELKVSPINTMRDGMGVAWIVCPLEIAVKIAERGVVNLGWTRVRIELMRKRPIQCFRCWHFGHVRTSCRSEVDRTGACFRCGVVGHPANNCNAGAPKCVICEEARLDYRHRIGSPTCLFNQGFPRGVQPVKRVPFDAVGEADGGGRA